MNTDLAKRFNMIWGFLSLFAGCVGLVVLIILISHIEISISGIMLLICLCIFDAISFYTSINSFIKYGISCGIDYALEKHEEKLIQSIKNVNQ